jgi:hypothetical protein
MWLRIDGDAGKVLGFDNMDSRPVSGTTEWKRYDIVLDVPAAARDIAFGFFLTGNGEVWADGFKIDKVDQSVSATAAAPQLKDEPANLDFESGR